MTVACVYIPKRLFSFYLLYFLVPNWYILYTYVKYFEKIYRTCDI